jgi:fatty acid desaturase
VTSATLQEQAKEEADTRGNKAEEKKMARKAAAELTREAFAAAREAKSRVRLGKQSSAGGLTLVVLELLVVAVLVVAVWWCWWCWCGCAGGSGV